MSTHRSLATVFFIDIVGSTERAAELGDRGWGEILHRFHTLVTREVRRRGGEIVTAAGDGYMAIFDGPGRAILAACLIRDRVRDELELEVRAGLHMGKIGRAGRSAEGIGLHIGARVAAEAAPGEVLVSSTVREAETGSGFVFSDRGVRVLKGMPEEWRLYAVDSVPEEEAGEERGLAGIDDWRVAGLGGWRLAATAAVAIILAGVAVFALLDDGTPLSPEAAVANAAEPGIAILPFTVNDPELERWREGMVNLLATNLDGVAGLRAIDSRTILARWRSAVPEGGEADLATALEVGSEAGGRYALVGSAVSSGTGLRLVAEVYDLEDGARSLGQRQIEGSPDSIFALVDRLSIAVLEQILAEEGTPTPVDVASITTRSVPAIRAFLEGEALMRESRFAAAADAFERAIEADSTFALAHFRLYEAYSWQEPGSPIDFDDPLEAAYRLRERLPEREGRFLEVIRRRAALHPEATSFARQTVQEYPDDPRAWYQLGEVLFHFGSQSLATRAETEEPLRRAIRLDPNFTPAYIHLLDLAFFHADSAAVDSFLVAYERQASGSVYDLGYRIAREIAFGSSAAREKRLAALDTLPTFALARTMRMLQHPLFLHRSLRVAPELDRRADMSPAESKAHMIGRFFLAGELNQSAALARDPETPAFSRVATLIGLYMYDRMGVIDGLVDAGIYARSFALPETGETSAAMSLAAAMFVADQGRIAAFEEVIARTRATADSALAHEDSTRARSALAIIEGMAGYRAASEGRREEAIGKLSSAYRATGIPAFLIWTIHALGREGRIEEAIRYVESVPPSPHLGVIAGPLYERAGNREAAIRAYEWVIQGWREADPQLQDEVQIARRAISRLGSTGGRR